MAHSETVGCVLPVCDLLLPKWLMCASAGILSYLLCDQRHWNFVVIAQVQNECTVWLARREVGVVSLAGGRLCECAFDI